MELQERLMGLIFDLGVIFYKVSLTRSPSIICQKRAQLKTKMSM